MSLVDVTQNSSMIEKGVIAASLDDPEIAGVIMELISPSDFHDVRNEIIYSKIVDFYQKGNYNKNSSFDIPQMVADLVDENKLHLVGGFDYFMEIIDPSAPYAQADPLRYAEYLKEFSRRRTIDLLGRSIVDKANPGSGSDSDDIVAFIQSNVQNLADDSSTTESMKLAQFSDELMFDIDQAIMGLSENKNAVSTGFFDLDELLGGGLYANQMAIIAGRPGMGKTTLALDIVRFASVMCGKTSLFFSLEMGRKELLMKLLASCSNVSYKKIKRGKDLTELEYNAVLEAKSLLDNSNIVVDDNENLDLARLRSKILKQIARPEGCDLVVIDYIQLMDAPKGESREREIAQISRATKLMTKEFGIPIIILAQLNRDAANQRPNVKHLRESGSLEQDADMVIMVHRPEVYDPNDKPGVAEIIVDKNRHGERGIVDVISLLEFSKFVNSTGTYKATEEPPNDLPPEPEENIMAGDFPDDPGFSGTQAYPMDAMPEADSGEAAW